MVRATAATEYIHKALDELVSLLIITEVVYSSVHIGHVPTWP